MAESDQLLEGIRQLLQKQSKLLEEKQAEIDSLKANTYTRKQVHEFYWATRERFTRGKKTIIRPTVNTMEIEFRRFLNKEKSILL